MKKNNSIFYDNKTFLEVLGEAFYFAIYTTFLISFISGLLLIIKNIIK